MLQAFLNKSFFLIIRDKGISFQDMIEMDTALWAIGSQVCVKQNRDYCKLHCSLETMCDAFPKNSKKGTWSINEEKKRVDVRKGSGYQLNLFD